VAEQRERRQSEATGQSRCGVWRRSVQWFWGLLTERMVLSAADQREGVEEGGWRMGPVSGGTRAITQEDGLEAWQPGRVGCGGRGERERERGWPSFRQTTAVWDGERCCVVKGDGLPRWSRDGNGSGSGRVEQLLTYQQKDHG
jgi:hypothetical protein